MTLNLPKIEKVDPLPPGVVDPPKEPVTPAKTATPRSVWIMGGVTVGAGVLTGVMGGLALSARGSLNKALATFPGEAATLADARSRTQDLRPRHRCCRRGHAGLRRHHRGPLRRRPSHGRQAAALHHGRRLAHGPLGERLLLVLPSIDSLRCFVAAARAPQLPRRRPLGGPHPRRARPAHPEARRRAGRAPLPPPPRTTRSVALAKSRPRPPPPAAKHCIVAAEDCARAARGETGPPPMGTSRLGARGKSWG